MMISGIVANMTTMDGSAKIALATSVFAAVVAGLNGWLIYRGSDRASRRSAAVQHQANSVDGFVQLTKEQREELTQARQRMVAAEMKADAAEQSAESAQRSAERALTQVAQLTTAYRELQQWASQPCPHPPPPQPPLRLVL